MEIRIDAVDDIIKTEDANIYILDDDNNVVTYSGKEWRAEYEKALAGIADGVIEPTKYIFDGEAYYADTFALSNGWVVVLTKSLKEAFAQSNAIGLYGVALFLIISLLIIPLVFFFLRLISKRSYKLINKIKAFMNSELILSDGIAGNDEFELLDERFTALAKELKSTIEEAYILQLQKNKYHLQMLQAQINPHFLYNTLSTIAWLSDNNPREEVRSAVSHTLKPFR